MHPIFHELNIPLYKYTTEDLNDLPLQQADKDLLLTVGLPVNSPPNSLRFAAPRSGGNKSFSRLSDEWPKFQRSEAAKACVVIASDSNGNSLFINTTPQGKHQVSFYDHDYDMVRFVAGSLETFIRCIAAYIKFQQGFAPFLPQGPSAGNADYIKLADELTNIEPLARANKDTFWEEMVFLGYL